MGTRPPRLLDALLLELTRTQRSPAVCHTGTSMARDDRDDTISPDEFIDPGFWSLSTLLLPFTLVKDAAGWVRDAIRQRGLPD